MSSKIKHREEQVYEAVMTGELTIDEAGRIWRLAARRGDRWQGGARTIPCAPRRAETRASERYMQVRATVDGTRWHALAHRLVWRHFHGPIPNGMTINHKNGVRSDNRPSNLELATDSEQQLHAIHVLGTARAANQDGMRNHAAKLTTEQVAEIRAARSAGQRLATIAARYGITFQHVSAIALGKTRSAG